MTNSIEYQMRRAISQHFGGWFSTETSKIGAVEPENV